jgi:outer membrane murein-binding lipoprotein Lpp
MVGCKEPIDKKKMTEVQTEVKRLEAELAELEAELKASFTELTNLQERIEATRERQRALSGGYSGKVGLIKQKKLTIELAKKREWNKRLPHPVCSFSQNYVIFRVTAKRLYLRDIHNDIEFPVTEDNCSWGRKYKLEYAKSRAAWEAYRKGD